MIYNKVKNNIDVVLTLQLGNYNGLIKGTYDLDLKFQRLSCPPTPRGHLIALCSLSSLNPRSICHLKKGHRVTIYRCSKGGKVPMPHCPYYYKEGLNSKF
uniref:Uncharacterized protein n=1 Tax=Micrurus carvalhoi TaxID=3147026 RepID=A0A2H6N453_9SAUR